MLLLQALSGLRSIRGADTDAQTRLFSGVSPGSVNQRCVLTGSCDVLGSMGSHCAFHLRSKEHNITKTCYVY